jgi:sigma-B regulation protein RsbU (phosphoserine phosphatase)
MSFRERSLAWRMAALILGGAGLVLFAVMAVSHFAQRRLLVEEQQARSDALTLAAVNSMETQLGRTEAAVQGAVAAFELLPGDRAAMVGLIERTLKTQTLLFGMAVALPAGENPSAGYRILYGSRQGGVVRIADRANPAADYLDDWFYLPYYLRQPVWSEPYYDQDAQTLMVTYSVPVMHEGRVVAVLTGDLTLAWIRQLLDGLPLGKGGTAVLLSAEGVFISHSERRVEMRETVYSLAEALATPEDTAALQELGWSMLSGQPGHRFYRRPLGGQRAYINHRPVAETGWALGVIIPEDQMLAALNRQTRTNLLVGACGLALLLVAALSVAFSVARPLKRLAFAADRLATGDFAAPLDATRRRDEVGRLTESFERLRKDLRRYIEELTTTTAAKEKIASELAIAHQIQLGIVPKLFPPFPNRRDLDLFAVLEPARDVGGDLYDFALLDDDHLYVAIGDVSGKGVPASLLMAVGKTLLKSTVQGVRDPARALTLVNTELAEDNDSCMFITAFCGIINLRTGDLTFASAGHNPPLIVRGDKPVEILRRRPGPALAALQGSRYQNEAVRLAADDMLLLYTDGVTEAMNPANELFGEERLVELMRAAPLAGTRPCIESIVRAVHAHAAGAEQSDDITLLAVRVHSFPDAAGPRAAAEPAPAARLTLANRKEELPRLVAWIDGLAETFALPPGLAASLNLALEEWVVNIVSYAYPDTAAHVIELRLWREGDTLRIEIEDDGRPFDPTAQAAPDTSAPLEQRRIGGLGIHFIRKTMDGMSYHRRNDHNVLTLVKRIISDVPAA